jgi:hypothetical protein
MSNKARKRSAPRRAGKKPARKKPATRWKVTFTVPVNGRVRRGEAVFTDRKGKVLHTDCLNPMDAGERRKAAAKAAAKIGGNPDDIEKAISLAWNQVYGDHLKAGGGGGAPRKSRLSRFPRTHLPGVGAPNTAPPRHPGRRGLGDTV